MMQLGRRKSIALGCLLAAMLLTAVARLGTQFYYLESMPRSPQPQSGRIYPAGAAYNTLVYVNKKELAWTNFIDYYMMTAVGVGVVLFVVLIFLPAARRSGQL